MKNNSLALGFIVLALIPLFSFAQSSPCNLGALPSLAFRDKSSCISNDQKAMLTAVAERMKQNVNCRVVVIGYCSNSKASQQNGWNRVNNVINFLADCRGIRRDRFIFSYGQEGGDCSTVELRQADPNEDGPSMVPAPYPNLKKLENCVLCDKKNASTTNPKKKR